jgi:hypothetical protein
MSKEPKRIAHPPEPSEPAESSHHSDVIEDLAKEMLYARSGRRASSIFGIAFSQTIKPTQNNEELLEAWMEEASDDDA